MRNPLEPPLIHRVRSTLCYFRQMANNNKFGYYPVNLATQNFIYCFNQFRCFCLVFVFVLIIYYKGNLYCLL